MDTTSSSSLPMKILDITTDIRPPFVQSIYLHNLPFAENVQSFVSALTGLKISLLPQRCSNILCSYICSHM